MPFAEDTIAKYLQDPLSFPPEFKSWFVKYLEQHQPQLQAGLLAGKLPTSKLSGQVPYSQLTLANSIVSADIVDGTIVNADINTAAAIAASKLAGYPADASKGLDGAGNWTGSMFKLYDQIVVGSVAANFDYTPVPGTFVQLKVVLDVEGDNAAANVVIGMRFNNDSGNNYSSQVVRGNAATASALETLANSSASVGGMPAAGAAVGLHAGAYEILIPNYSSGTLRKQWTSVGGWSEGSTTGKMFSETRTGHWTTVTAISRVTLLPSAGSFAIGSRCIIYGLGV